MAVAQTTGVDRVFLSTISSDPVGLMRLAAERMMPALPALEATAAAGRVA